MLCEHFTDVQKFLEKLRVSSPEWGEGWESDWLFRGHGNANWPLLPSAVREPVPRSIQSNVNLLKSFQYLKNFDLTENRREELMYQVSEMELLFQFAAASEEVGLPSYSPPSLRSMRTNIRHPNLITTIDYSKDPFTVEAIQLCALAQHHGVPTRLLDWTETAWIAAYFAAKDCFNLNYESDTTESPPMAVWAMRRDAIERTVRVRILNAPRAANDNLRAQRGVFTFDLGHEADFINDRKRLHLDQVVASFSKEHGDDCICRFTLDATCAPELLRCLFRERVSEHSMMPSYRSAAEQAKVVSIWDDARKIQQEFVKSRPANWEENKQ